MSEAATGGVGSVFSADTMLAHLLDEMPVGVFRIDAEGRPVFANRVAQELLGRGVAPDIGPDEYAETYQTFVAGTDDPYPADRMPIVRALNGETCSVDDMDIHVPGGCRGIEVWAAPIRGPENQVTGALAVFVDITSRREAERASRRAREEADRASQAKSEFLSRVSHELRTPLNAIVGFAQLLEMDPQLGPEQLDNVRQVLRGGNHLLDLINEVLDIARIESREMSLSVEPVRVKDVVDEVVGLAGPLTSARSIAITVECPEADRRWVAADRQRLKQALLNLVSNGVKYNTEGGSVSLRCGADGGRVRLSVTDTGPGIPPEKVDRLFRPFERLGAEQSSVEGTGLGLSLTKGLVQLMNGAIGVESTPGQGSTFWIELQESESPLRVVTEKSPERWGMEMLGSRPWTILYVEDNLSNMTVVERLLGRWPNIRLVGAMQGRMGIDLAVQHRPDVILLDLHLPDIPGQEVLAQLSANPAVSAIPVLILSADATPRQVERLMDAGATAYLTKPLDLRAFLEALEDVLGRSRALGPL